MRERKGKETTEEKKKRVEEERAEEFLGNAPVSCNCKKQKWVSNSSTEVEYRAMSLAYLEIVWL